MSTSHPAHDISTAAAVAAGPRVAVEHDETLTGADGPNGKPTRPRRQVLARRVAVLGAALAVIVGASLWLVYASPFLDVQKVRVAGQGAIPVERITGAAAIATGSALVSVDTAAVARQVASVPEVRRVAVTRDWPHTVVISVTPRTPVAVAVKGSGYELVDGDGVAIGEVAKAPAATPLMRPGAGDDRKAAAAALEALPPEVRAMVSQVAVANGEIRFQLGDDAATVVWGGTDDTALKAKVLPALLLQAGSATWFDVSVPGSPTTSDGEPVRPGRRAPAKDPFFGTPATKPSAGSSASPAASGGGEQQAVPGGGSTGQENATPDAPAQGRSAEPQGPESQDPAGSADGQQGVGGEQSLGLR